MRYILDLGDGGALVECRDVHQAAALDVVAKDVVHSAAGRREAGGR